MSNLWFNLLYLMGVWGFAIYSKAGQVELSPVTILLTALFFIIYFCLPLIRHHKGIFEISIILLNAIVFLNFWAQTFNGFIFLILIMVAKTAIEYGHGKSLYFHIVIQYMIFVSPYILNQNFMLFAYVNLLIIFTSFLVYIWSKTNKSYGLLSAEYDKLQNNYRKLKRQIAVSEKIVRQEERNQIAREIHDSVGHRLTALLMQLEIIRLQTTNVLSLEKINHLKSLAQVSLSETREAVKALKSEETTGLTAVIQLIRKLEAESHLQVAFIIKAGALSAPLTNNQSIALYRAVQESLTNMMRHSKSREAEIEFSVIGEKLFEFKLSNPQKNKVEFVEGFGLTAMRERIEQLNGRLKISQVEGKFVITGSFPIEKGE